MTPLVEVLARTTEFFRQKGIPSARLDAELLLGHVLGLDRVKVYLNFDRPLYEADLERLRPLVRRRGAREPLAWVLGEKEFYGRDFTVLPGVLVPRPDTETLIEAALAHIPADADPVFVADVGCGSGCIGLTLAAERPGLRLFALDRAEEALATTRANVERLGLGARVAVRRVDPPSGRGGMGQALGAIPADRPIDWVVSNPPYIPAAEIDGLSPEIRDHEPRLALDGGADGLDAYRSLVPAALARARRGVLLEVGDGQAGPVSALLEGLGVRVSTRKDLSGMERVVIGEKVEG